MEPLLVTRNERTLTATYPRTARVEDPLRERSVILFFCNKNNTARGPQALLTVFLQVSCFSKIPERAQGKSLGDRERTDKSGTRWCAGYPRATVHPVTGGNVQVNEYVSGVTEVAGRSTNVF